MKSASLFVVLVLSLTILALAFVMVDPAAAADPVIVGKWDRTDGVDVYTIYANHVTETVIEGQTYRGTWEHDGADGYKYIFRWEHSPPDKSPFIDYVTVAADGQSYSGINNYGDDFHCVRIGDAPAVDSGGFPVVPVAIGGGIAAVAAGGAAAYYFLIAKHGAESAGSGASGAGAVRGQTNEVAINDPKQEWSSKLGKWECTEGSDKLVQENYREILQHELQDGKTRLKLQEEVRDQTNKTQQQIQQNRINNQNKIKEQMQQELKDQSQTTQEVADTEESGSNANA